MNTCMYINIHFDSRHIRRDLQEAQLGCGPRRRCLPCFCFAANTRRTSSWWQRTKLPALITDVMEHSYASLQRPRGRVPACLRSPLFIYLFSFFIRCLLKSESRWAVYSPTSVSLQRRESPGPMLTLTLMLTRRAFLETSRAFHPAVIHFAFIPIHASSSGTVVRDRVFLSRFGFLRRGCDRRSSGGVQNDSTKAGLSLSSEFTPRKTSAKACELKQPLKYSHSSPFTSLCLPRAAPRSSRLAA